MLVSGSTRSTDLSSGSSQASWAGGGRVRRPVSLIVDRRKRAQRSQNVAEGAVGWMGTRVYLGVQVMRQAPQLYYAVVLGEIEQVKGAWMYADHPIYSFHTGGQSWG